MTASAVRITIDEALDRLFEARGETSAMKRLTEFIEQWGFAPDATKPLESQPLVRLLDHLIKKTKTRHTLRPLAHRAGTYVSFDVENDSIALRTHLRQVWHKQKRLNFVEIRAVLDGDFKTYVAAVNAQIQMIQHIRDQIRSGNLTLRGVTANLYGQKTGHLPNIIEGSVFDKDTTIVEYRGFEGWWVICFANGGDDYKARFDKALTTCWSDLTIDEPQILAWSKKPLSNPEPPSKIRRTNGRDYRSVDLDLILKMHEFVQKGESVENAARRFYQDAKGSGAEDSKVKRLAKHYRDRLAGQGFE